MQPYKKIAPNYFATTKLIKNIFSEEFKTISQFNYKALKTICVYLDIPTPISIFSEMNLQIDTVCNADEWALNIAKALKINEYINPIGGQGIFDDEKFVRNNINLKFLETNNIIYNQKRNQFEAGLSIIDVMMFKSSNEINKMLNNYTITN